MLPRIGLWLTVLVLVAAGPAAAGAQIVEVYPDPPTPGARGSMFLIDTDGIVQHAWVSMQLSADIPFDEIEDALPTA